MDVFLTKAPTRFDHDGDRAADGVAVGFSGQPNTLSRDIYSTTSIVQHNLRTDTSRKRAYSSSSCVFFFCSRDGLTHLPSLQSMGKGSFSVTNVLTQHVVTKQDLPNIVEGNSKTLESAERVSAVREPKSNRCQPDPCNR